MLGKDNSASDPITGARMHGSAVVDYNDPLDQERAASMADEGGAAGAHTDTLERRTEALERMQRARLLPIVGMIALGAAAGLCMLLLSRARQPSRRLRASQTTRWLRRAFAR